MAEYIYPNGEIRRNYMARMYCEMALEGYYDASLFHDKIVKSGYSYDEIDTLDDMNKRVVATIVFSAMAIEAFINDYAAACLGDSDFYDNFDRLSVLSKFELIARFILKSDIDKGKAYYYYLKTLIKQRDAYVHSKSLHVPFPDTSENDSESYNYALEHGGVEIPLLDKQELEKDFRSARDALKAIKEFADYFDRHDHGAYAVPKLFGPSPALFVPGKEGKYKKHAFSMLGINVRDYSEI